MNNIAICIPTYKRIGMLNKLIDSINICKIDNNFIKDINIIVVDNDVEMTAKNLVEKLKMKVQNPFRLHYFSYSVKGLANVRNELINRALLFNPEFLVFIDDDEFVTENWLNELVRTILTNHADAARGPVFANISNKISTSIAYLLERENYENNSLIDKWTTGNLIIRRSSIEKFDVRFDPRFNSTGSEDTFFGRQMAQKGATLFWAANAVTYEEIPEKRTSINWFIKRAYRGAATYVFILKIEKDYLKIVNKVIVSFVYLLIGLVTLPIIILPIKLRYYGIIKISHGIGALAGLFDFQYREYK
jgi:succinoglycan biosynthesis protein ExoM